MVRLGLWAQERTSCLLQENWCEPYFTCTGCCPRLALDLSCSNLRCHSRFVERLCEYAVVPMRHVPAHALDPPLGARPAVKTVVKKEWHKAGSVVKEVFPWLPHAAPPWARLL